MRKTLSLMLAFVVAATFLAAHEGADHSHAAKSYVGNLVKAPGGAMIGVVVEGEQFLAYVCSDADSFNASHVRWFRGKVEQGGIAAEVGGAKLTAKLSVGKVEGTVTGADKNAFLFTAIESKSGGLYRAEMIVGKDHYIAGWVRNDSGATVGTASKNKGVQNRIPPASPVNTKAPPAGIVNQKKLAGKQIDELGLPLPGQVLQATLVSIDAKKNQFTVKTLDGKSLTLQGNELTSTNAKGTRSRENLGAPTPFFKIGGFFHFTRECVETTTVNKKSGTTTKSKKCSIDAGFGSGAT